MNPWLILGALAAWLASLWAVGAWQRDEGRTAERAAWEARDNETLRKANGEIKRLTDDARDAERRRVDEMTVLSINYSKGFRDAEADRRRDVAAARDGALRLRIPAAACDAGGSAPAAAGPAAPGGDGAEGIELPGATAADLLDLAHDADQVADQLRACQAVVLNDRKDLP